MKALWFGGRGSPPGEKCCMRDVIAGRTLEDLDASGMLCSGTVGFRESCYMHIHESELKCTCQRSAGRQSPSARNPRRRQVLAPTDHFIRKPIFSKLPPKSIGTTFSCPEIYRVNGLNMILVG